MISTRVGLHTSSENFFFGYRTLGELLGDTTVTGLYSILIKGVKASTQEIEVLDAIAVAICSADPHIWPLKLSRVVSSYGGSLAGSAASYLVCDNTMISPAASSHTANTLTCLASLIGNQIDDLDAVSSIITDFLAQKHKVIGLGVPLREYDERYVALSEWINSKGYDTKYYWKLQAALSRVAKAEYNVGSNILLGTTAALLDLEYSPIQISSMMMLLIQSPFAANVYESSTQRSPEMRSLPISDIEYVGKPPRKSPKSDQ